MKKSAKTPFKKPTILARKVFIMVPFWVLGCVKFYVMPPAPRTLKKHVNIQADGYECTFYNESPTREF